MKKKEFLSFHEISQNISFAINNNLTNNPQNWPEEWKIVNYNKYPRFPLLKATNNVSINNRLIDVLHERKSFQKNEKNVLLTSAELFTILKHSLGLKNDKKEFNQRVYPSAGARFPIECYLIINKMEEIQQGLYHFDIVNDGLNILLEKNLTDEITKIFGEKFKNSQVLLILTSVIDRNYIKYGERAYRFSLIESGHAMQNICLLSTALQIPMTPIGGFVDSKLIRLLDLEKEREFPIYCCAFL